MGNMCCKSASDKPICSLKVTGNNTSCCKKAGGLHDEVKLLFDMLNHRIDEVEKKLIFINEHIIELHRQTSSVSLINLTPPPPPPSISGSPMLRRLEIAN